MKLNNLINLIILLAYVSCSKKNPMPEDNVRILYVDVTEKVEVNYSQLFDTCYIIPLETIENYFIGKMDKVILSGKSIIVLDSKMSRSVFVYNLEGKLQNVIDDLGEGPTEYLHPFTISLSENGDEIIIYDSKGMKVVFYTLDGRYVKTVKLGSENRYTDLIVLEDKYFITGGDLDSKLRKITVLDEQFEVKNSIITSLPEDIWLFNSMKKKYFFEKSDRKGFYHNGWYTNRILNIFEGQIE